MNHKTQKISGRFAAAFGVSFIWFSTQFGGGFASGAQLKSYFVRYGIWCLMTCLGAEAICAVYNAYIAYYCRKHETYDYRSFNNAFFGRFAPIYANLYELVYFFTLLVVPAVAFATGGATLSALTGLSTTVCAALIGGVIFLASVLGTSVVRNIEIVVSLFILAVIFAVYLPAILSQWDSVTEGVQTLMDTPSPIFPALWGMVIYAAFQIASSPAIHSQHARILQRPKDAVCSYLLGFVLNTAVILVLILGILGTVLDPEYANVSVPFVLLAQGSADEALFTKMISVLIVLGSVSTAINMVSAATERIAHATKKGDTPKKKRGRSVLAALLLTLIGFLVARFGLLPMIQKGYNIMAYITLPTIAVPFVVQAVYTRCDTKEPSAQNAGKSWERY